MKSKLDFASMMALRQYIHNTIIGGVFFLIPLFVLLMVATEGLGVFSGLGRQFGENDGVRTSSRRGERIHIVSLPDSAGLFPVWLAGQVVDGGRHA